MKKYSILFLFALGVSFAQAQNAAEKTLSEICSCVKKIDKKTSENAQTDQALVCMSSGVEKNIAALKKEYNIQTDDLQQAAQELASKLGMELLSGCPEILPYLMAYAQKQQAALEDTDDIKTDTLKLDAKTCPLFKSGKYRRTENYINRKALPDSDPTAYTEVKDGFVFDYSQSNKYITKWSIRWISDCEWEQTLVETSEPNLKSVMKKGDKLTLKALGSTKAGGLWVSSKFLGMELLVLLKKI